LIKGIAKNTKTLAPKDTNQKPKPKTQTENPNPYGVTKTHRVKNYKAKTNLERAPGGNKNPHITPKHQINITKMTNWFQFRYSPDFPPPERAANRPLKTARNGQATTSPGGN
jgi:hypothetical protein